MMQSKKIDIRKNQILLHKVQYMVQSNVLRDFENIARYIGNLDRILNNEEIIIYETFTSVDGFTIKTPKQKIKEKAYNKALSLLNNVANIATEFHGLSTEDVALMDEKTQLKYKKPFEKAWKKLLTYKYVTVSIPGYKGWRYQVYGLNFKELK